jgi:hypothetical protein
VKESRGGRKYWLVSAPHNQNSKRMNKSAITKRRRIPNTRFNGRTCQAGKLAEQTKKKNKRSTQASKQNKQTKKTEREPSPSHPFTRATAPSINKKKKKDKDIWD